MNEQIVIGKQQLFLDNKAFIVLKRIYGIGSVFACKICSYIGCNPQYSMVDFNIKHCFFVQISNIFAGIEFFLENYLKREIYLNLYFMRRIRTYRGIRFSRGLPVRGQRSQTNAITARKLNKLN